MPKLDSLDPLLNEELRDLLDAEKQLTRALPKMARSASSPDLKAAFEEHLEQTEQQLSRLQQAFGDLGQAPRPKKCAGMRGLIEEGEEVLKEAEKGPVRDAALIAAAQKAEHYEISAYGTARTHAEVLGHGDVASLLEQTLKEEKATDEKLTGLAEGISNPEAAGREPAEGRSSRQRQGGASARSTAADTGRRSNGGARRSRASGRKAR